MSRTDGESLKLKLLCVEDDGDALNYLCSLLTMKFPEAEVLTAMDGETGLRLFMARRPQIVITDLSLPLLEGTALAARIRALSPETRVIAVSAHSDIAAQHLPADLFACYLLKPLNFKELAHAIETYRVPSSLSPEV